MSDDPDILDSVTKQHSGEGDPCWKNTVIQLEFSTFVIYDVFYVTEICKTDAYR